MKDLNFDLKLIALIRKNPCLYINTHESYKNRKLSAPVWAKVAKELNVSVARLKCRWKCLRNKFRLEVPKLGKTNPDPTKSNWVYSPMMTFLLERQRTQCPTPTPSPPLSPYPNNEFDTLSMYGDETTNELAEMDDASAVSETENLADLAVDHAMEHAVKMEKFCTDEYEIDEEKPQNMQAVVPVPELQTFMDALTVKIINENLSRDQMDELEEKLLVVINMELRKFRNTNRTP